MSDKESDTDLELDLTVYVDGEEPTDVVESPPGQECLVVKLQSKKSVGPNPYDLRSPHYLLFECFRTSNRGNYNLYVDAISRCLFESYQFKVLSKTKSAA